MHSRTSQMGCLPPVSWRCYPHLLVRTRREPFDSPWLSLRLNNTMQPLPMAFSIRCASSFWIFRTCVVSTTNLYSFGVAVGLAPFALRTALPSPWPDVTPATTTEPPPCCTRSPEARSAATLRGEAGAQQFPRSRYVPQADGLRLSSNPFDAAASSGSALVPVVVGIERSRPEAFPGRFLLPGTEP
jgi:hypothetical protein